MFSCLFLCDGVSDDVSYAEYIHNNNAVVVFAGRGWEGGMIFPTSMKGHCDNRGLHKYQLRVIQLKKLILLPFFVQSTEMSWITVGE